MTLCSVLLAAFSALLLLLAVTTAVVVAVVVVVVTSTHRYNAFRGHRTGSNNVCSSVQYARNIVKLFLDETHARGAQIRYVTRTYVWLFGEESACTTGRRAFGCSDTVMVNI